MDTSTQPRVAAGSPEGGQYTAVAGAEADRGLPGTSRISDLDPAELLALCQMAARRTYGRRRQSAGGQFDAAHIGQVDDLAQEVAVALLTTPEDRVVLDTRSYALGISRVVMAQHARKRHGGANIAARSLLAQRLQELQDQGVPADNRRMRDIVRQIIDEWPLNHEHGRPTFDFATDPAPVPIHDNTSNLIADRAGEATHHLRDSGGAAYEHIERGGRAGHAAARALAWNAVAEMRHAPMARRASLSHHAVTASRALVYGHDRGLRGVIDDWEKGIDTRETRALFAPWGEPAPHHQREIVDLLRTSSYGDELWESALLFANSRFRIDGLGDQR